MENNNYDNNNTPNNEEKVFATQDNTNDTAKNVPSTEVENNETQTDAENTQLNIDKDSNIATEQLSTTSGNGDPLVKVVETKESKISEAFQQKIKDTKKRQPLGVVGLVLSIISLVGAIGYWVWLCVSVILSLTNQSSGLGQLFGDKANAYTLGLASLMGILVWIVIVLIVALYIAFGVFYIIRTVKTLKMFTRQTNCSYIETSIEYSNILNFIWLTIDALLVGALGKTISIIAAPYAKSWALYPSIILAVILFATGLIGLINYILAKSKSKKELSFDEQQELKFIRKNNFKIAYKKYLKRSARNTTIGTIFRF